MYKQHVTFRSGRPENPCDIERLEQAVLRTPSKVAIQMIALYGDQAEEKAYVLSLSPRAKEGLLLAIRNRRVQQYNRRGW